MIGFDLVQEERERHQACNASSSVSDVVLLNNMRSLHGSVGEGSTIACRKTMGMPSRFDSERAIPHCCITRRNVR